MHYILKMTNFCILYWDMGCETRRQNAIVSWKELVKMTKYLREKGSKVFKHCIDIGYSQVPEKDYDFWVVAFHGPNDETIYRKDSDKNEIAGYFRDPDKYCKVWREFQTDVTPTYWVVWPHSESKGWCDRITGQLNHNHVS